MKNTIPVAMAMAAASAACGQSCGNWDTTILNPPNSSSCAVTCVGSTFQGGMRNGAPVAWSGSMDSLVSFSAPQSTTGSVQATYGQSLGGSDRFGRPCLWRGPAFEYVSLDYRAGLVWGISQGVQVGDIYGDGGSSRATIWRDGIAGGAALPTMSSTASSYARGVAGGQVVGSVWSGQPRAALWSISSGTPDIVNLHPDFASGSRATSTDGFLQGGYIEIVGGSRAVLWSGSAASVVVLDPRNSAVTAMSVGVQAGYVVIAGNNRAFIWRGTPESGEDITPPWALSGYATGVWSDGSRVEVVGSCMSWYGQAHEVLWTYEYSPTCCPADLNRDDVVDADDLGKLLSNWGFVSPNTIGDLNGDWAVNGADVGQLLAAWGACTN
jgi:hypothetical protein